jgi:hypothetical protein
MSGYGQPAYSANQGQTTAPRPAATTQGSFARPVVQAPVSLRPPTPAIRPTAPGPSVSRGSAVTGAYQCPTITGVGRVLGWVARARVVPRTSWPVCLRHLHVSWRMTILEQAVLFESKDLQLHFVQVVAVTSQPALAPTELRMQLRQRGQPRRQHRLLPSQVLPALRVPQRWAKVHAR